MLAVLVSAVSYTTIACVSEPESEQRLSQANLVENEKVVTGEILGIEDERVRLRLPEGEIEAIMIPRSEIERLGLLPKRLITAELDAEGRATEVSLAQVVYPIQTATPEAVGLAQVQSAPTATPETREVAPVPPAPTSIAQAQPPTERPTAVRALW